MNKVFKVVWSKVKGCYVVASELAKSHTKAPKSGVLSRTLVAGVLACVCTFGASVPSYAAIAEGDNNPVTGGDVWNYLHSWTIGIGANSNPSYSSISIGPDSSAGYDGTALGHDSHSNGYSVAVGYNTSAENESIVVGNQSAAGQHSVSIGISTGYSDLHTTPLVPAANAVSIGYQSTTYDTGVSIGYQTHAGVNAVAIGKGSSAYNGGAVAIGQDVSAKGYESVSFGNNTKSNAEHSIAIGKSSVAGWSNQDETTLNAPKNAVAIGSAARAIQNSSIAFGWDAVAGAEDAIAIGTNALVGEPSATDSNSPLGEGSIAIGREASATGLNSVAIGKFSKTMEDNVFSVGDTNKERRITNVAAGVNPTDAVNVSQLDEALAGVGGSSSGDSYVAGNGITFTDKTLTVLELLESGVEPEDLVNYGINEWSIEGIRTAWNDGSPTNPDAWDLNQETTATAKVVAAKAGNGITVEANGISAKAGTNVTVNSSGINVTGNGTVASNNTGLISGGTAYTELRPAANGTFIKKTNTTAANLTALDEAINNATLHDIGIQTYSRVSDDANYNGEGAVGGMSIAIGGNASATGVRGIAMGVDAKANVPYALAIGSYANASYDYENSTDGYTTAVGAQAAATDEYASAFGGFASAAKNSTAVGHRAKAYGKASIAVGHGALAKGENSITIGTATSSTYNFGSGDNVVSIGTIKGAPQGMGTYSNSVFIGKDISMDDRQGIYNKNVIIGGETDYDSNATDSVTFEGNITIGYNNELETASVEKNMTNNILIGNNSRMEEGRANEEYTNNISIGYNNTIYNNAYKDVIAIGNNITVSDGVDRIIIGSGSAEGAEHTVSFGKKDNERRLVNIAEGINGTDAVNVNQLNTAIAGIEAGQGKTYTAGSNIEISDTDEISAVANGTITAGSTGLVTGNTVYEALQNINIPESTQYTAGSHIMIGTDHSISAVVDGTVSSGNAGLVNGGQVYDAIQNIRPNIYIGGNGIVINGDTNTVSVKNVVMYDGDAQDTATLAGTRGTKLTNLKSAELTRTSMDAVNGNQLWTTNENIKGVKNSVNINTTNISALNTSMTNALESVTALGTLVDTIDNLKADASLNNLNDAGKQVIATAAANAVQEYMAGNSKVVPMNKVVMNNVVPDDWSSIDDELSLKADKDDVYSKSETDTLLDAKADMSVVSDLETNLTGNIAALDERVTSAENAIQDTRDVLDTKANKDDVYDKTEVDSFLADKADKADLDTKADKTDLEAKAEVDASNIDVDKWAEKLGTGEIAEGNTGLVNGGTVFEAMKNVGGNDMIKAGTDAIEIGSDAKYDGMNSVSIAKSDGTGRALRGVLVDPDDDTSAANVGYVNAVAENIATGVNQGFAKLDDKINKTGANAAALANLHPIADDGDTKWNVAAGFGRYHGESAGAVGLFYKPSDRVAMNISSTIGDDVMFGAGVSVAIDKPVSNGLSKVQMAQTINAQAEHIKQQDERIARLEAAMAQMARNQK